MATETVISDHTAINEVEKKVNEEVKTVPPELVSPSNETEEEKPKAEASPSPEAPSKSEEKEEVEPSSIIREIEKTGESPVVDEEVKPVEQETLSSVKEIEEEKSMVEEEKALEQETISPSKETEEEKPKAAESQSLEVTLPEAEEKMEDKRIEPSPVIKEVEKSGDAQVSDEEVKPVEQETIYPSKEPKAGELRSPEAPSSKSEEKMVDEQTEPSLEIKEVEKIGDALSGEDIKTVEQETLSPSKETEEEKLKAEEVKKVEQEKISPSQETEEEKPKDAESQSPEAPSSKPEEKMVDVQTETSSIIKEVEKTDDTPVLDVPVEDNSTEAKESFPDAPEPVVQPAVESVEEQPPEKPAVESIEKQPDEKRKIVDSAESSIEAIKETEEPVEVFPVKESEAVVKEREDSESGSIKVEKQEPAVPEVEEKPQEEPEATEKVNTESDIEHKESAEIEIVKDKETLADKVEDTIVLKEEETKKDQEPFPSATADQLVLINQEAQADPKGDGWETSLPRVSEKEVKELEKIKEDEANYVKTENENEEHVSTKELTQPEILKVEEVSNSISNAEVTEKLLEGKNANTEEDNKDNVIISTQPESKTIEDASSSLAATEVTEKLFEGENTSRDVELFSENKKEELTSVETDKDGELEGKLDEVTTADIVKPTTEPPETELEVKGESRETELELKEEETAKASKEVNEAAKSDVPLESAKDGVDEKTTQDLPKQEVSAKRAQKQSNNIISKVKQSLVKAKKAITGKSSRSTQRDIKISSV
ncbi:retinitis pigmentosa 1-like 1 protein [Vitis riparia]|uniref:retinitis pigmentosa 1-like 1 protein n=1 Tax=Vitis riparia TaxID=96939 RepID=UPI00155AEB20|nr:retinitis pigmentosa 1-like 1 protein [Vitis riparia]